VPNPFCHVELNTTDLKKAKDFYSQLFNWKLEDMPDGSYTMIRVGEGTGGGMMNNPVPGAPSFWLSYVLVDDIQGYQKSEVARWNRDAGSYRNSRLWVVQCARRSNRRAFCLMEAQSVTS